MIVVAAIPTDMSPARAATLLADLAREQELVVVCGYPAVTVVLASLRSALPRFDIVGIVVDPPTSVEGDLIDLLLEQGTLPVVLTAEGKSPEVVSWLIGRLDGAVNVVPAGLLSHAAA
jgi:hypothetical protein